MMKPKSFYTKFKQFINSLIIILSITVFGVIFFEQIVFITGLVFMPLIITSCIIDFAYSYILKSIGGKVLEKEVPKYVTQISSFFKNAGLFLFAYFFDEYSEAFILLYQNGDLPDINMNLLHLITFLMLSAIVARVVYIGGVKLSEAVGAFNLRKKGFPK